VQGYRISPYLQELMVFAGVSEVYSAGNLLLEKVLRIPLSASSVYRVTVSTAENLPEADLYESITQESVYAQVDGSMLLTDEKWKEVKVGRVFGRDAQSGQADLANSRYCAYLGAHPEFCKRFEGLLPAFLSIVFITDGAEWIKQWMDRSYPKALQILDFYHAFQHLAQSVSGLILPSDWLLNQKKLLLESKLDTLIANVKALKYFSEEKQEKLINYYEHNRYRMDYAAYRQAGYCIGSGAIEAAHKTLIQERMKRSGQIWSPKRAQELLKLRVAYKSNRFQKVTQTICNAA
jgi:hypothetical protein